MNLNTTPISAWDNFGIRALKLSHKIFVPQMPKLAEQVVHHFEPWARSFASIRRK